VKDYPERLPEDWVRHGGVFIPMYQREALWIRFMSLEEMPYAVKVAAGKMNAVSGKPWRQQLEEKDKDYVVSPPQPWLDGFNAGDGFIKQFVAMPLGMGYTVEGQLTGKEKFGGVQIVVYPLMPEMIERLRRRFARARVICPAIAMSSPGVSHLSMGLGAGGRIRQKIYPDPYGLNAWDRGNSGRVYVHILNSMSFRAVTGLEPPPTPVTAKTYAEYGLPWFDLYDEKMGDVPAGEELKGVKSVKEMDQQKGFKPPQEDDSIEIPDDKVIKYKASRRKVESGGW